jgi:hypothetical protein
MYVSNQQQQGSQVPLEGGVQLAQNGLVCPNPRIPDSWHD